MVWALDQRWTWTILTFKHGNLEMVKSRLKKSARLKGASPTMRLRCFGVFVLLLWNCFHLRITFQPVMSSSWTRAAPTQVRQSTRQTSQTLSWWRPMLQLCATYVLCVKYFLTRFKLGLIPTIHYLLPLCNKYLHLTILLPTGKKVVCRHKAGWAETWQWPKFQMFRTSFWISNWNVGNAPVYEHD